MAKNAGVQHAQNIHINQDDASIGDQLAGANVFSVGTIDSYATIPSGTEMWFGNGNLPTNYNLTTDANAHIQQGLKVHVRNGPDITPTSSGANGEQFYNAPAGVQSATRAAWNFDYAVNTAFGNDVISAAKVLANYDFKMEVTQLVGGSVSHQAIFDLDPATHVWTDEANPAATFGGDDFSPPKGASADVMARVAENSVNLGFAGLQSDFGPLVTSTAAGTEYDVRLVGFKGGTGNMMTFTHDHITLVPPT